MNEDTESLCQVNYAKRRNNELFTQLKEESIMDMEQIQNYIPIYDRFFEMNSSNCEYVNMGSLFHINKIVDKDTSVVYRANLSNVDGKKIQNELVFCKIMPLTDPYKYLTGKTFYDTNIFNLPTYFDKSESNQCLIDVNNSAYVDGMFTYFTSLLKNYTTFVHGVSYYGAFIGIKRNLAVNIYEDLEYLHGSSFFNTHKNVEFQVEDYSTYINDIIETGTARKGHMPPISISSLAESSTSIDINQVVSDIKDISYDGLFEESNDMEPHTIISLADLAASDLEIVSSSIVDSETPNENINNVTINDGSSSSSCSSRTSCTSENENENDNDNESSSESSDDWSDESGSDDDPIVLATLPKFPVEVVFMEKMEYTLDTLMSREEIPNKEWFSILMQVIMILITYQRVFSFTHNDLHSSNIMFNDTNKAYLFYKVAGSYYKVPTFGRIAKIIDFGRSIYTYNEMVICSDSFKPGEDASTQYNTEPYYNPNKPRIDPNFSFDLCRLACSIYDDLEDELESETDHNPVFELIKDWCMDDSGRNVLYKSNGEERYPSFKLYKMIARQVHRHTPEAQLSRKEFSQYLIKKKDILSKYTKHIMNIDEFPTLKSHVEINSQSN